MKFISLGGNCMVAGQLRRICKIKTTYFDNLVTPLDSLVKVLGRGLHRKFAAEDFDIGVWEEIPSAVERETGVFFHHEFRNERGNDNNKKPATRESIQAGVKDVNDKFAYLSERFLKIARNSGKKCFIRREYRGNSIDADEMLKVQEALLSIGAQNFSLLNIHTNSFYQGLVVEKGIKYYYIPHEAGDGWMGRNAEWDSAILAAAVDAGAIR